MMVPAKVIVGGGDEQANTQKPSDGLLFFLAEDWLDHKKNC